MIAPRLKTALVKLTLFAAGLMISLLVVEGSARVISQFGDEAPITHKEYRGSRPAPYRDSPFFSQEFIDEQFRQPTGWTTPPGTRLVIPGDFSGKFYNIVGGRRRTVWQPDSAPCRVLLFGGSTLYNTEVPDEFTVASLLQRKFNERAATPCRVENYGTTSVTAAQQLELLKTVALLPGDTVIFYDGVNEIFQGIFFNHPEGWIVGENREALNRVNPFVRFMIKSGKRYEDHSAAIKLLMGRVFDPNLAGNIVHLSDPAQLEVAISRTATTYQISLRQTFEYLRSKNVPFLHFYQPNLMSRGELSPYERALVANKSIVGSAQAVAFSSGSAPLRDAALSLNREGLRTVDLSMMFQVRKPDEEFFVDVCHVADGGNERIAEAFFRELSTTPAIKTAIAPDKAL
jgi:hypothetical protein